MPKGLQLVLCSSLCFLVKKYRQTPTKVLKMMMIMMIVDL